MAVNMKNPCIIPTQTEGISSSHLEDFINSLEQKPIIVGDFNLDHSMNFGMIMLWYMIPSVILRSRNWLEKLSLRLTKVSE